MILKCIPATAVTDLIIVLDFDSIIFFSPEDLALLKYLTLFSVR